MSLRGELSAATASEAASHRLRQDIVSGALAPDTQLKMRELKSRYGIGASPMREALAQLAAEGFVELRGQKGFRVPPISAENLLDITQTRQLLEAVAIRLAIEHADSAWEDKIISTFHIFEREVDRFYKGSQERLDVYEERHHQFHQALIANCPLQSLKTFCDALYIKKTRYRLLTRSYGFSRDTVIAEHRMLMEIVLARKADRAAQAISSHIGLTADIALAVLRQKSTGKKRSEKAAKGVSRKRVVQKRAAKKRVSKK